MVDPEIDIVLPEKKLLFEIKYTDDTPKNTVPRVAEYAKDEGFKPFIVTDDLFDTREFSGIEVQLIPLWFLCLANLY